MLIVIAISFLAAGIKGNKSIKKYMYYNYTKCVKKVMELEVIQRAQYLIWKNMRFRLVVFI